MRKRSAPTRRFFCGLATAAAAAPFVAARSARPVWAQTAANQPVDLNLVLAVDVSGSVNQRRFELQRDGYAAAFRNPRVLKAVRGGGLQGAIAVTVVQWTGPALQVHVVPWTLIRDEASISAFAAAIETAPRQLYSGGTSISGAIDRGAALLARPPYAAMRRVIDISGDGANNRGRPAVEARDDAIAKGITINGLPILELEPNLDEHYKNNVIGGPNAFMVIAQTFEEFADAVLKKLVTEIADDTTAPHPAALPPED